ncbi:hypothetical protein D9757_011390 [Collybiopsis confluens]|uniref:Major facilitator superfamily (MFS) profile domain-containing protein n=1 Tax=Collybiopsis confluens TaxID=2823264 RepID=A0A8H5GKX2_9AGAR|nr:hypothetical protein D9757_011390 [Collybiopsis confluens]
MAPDIIRDAPLGMFINHISRGRLLPFPEQLPNFTVPTKFLPPKSDDVAESNVNKPNDLFMKEGKNVAIGTAVAVEDEEAETMADGDQYTVGWYSDTDSANPQNWSTAKKSLLVFSVTFLTFTSYVGAAIYTPSIPGIQAEFDSSLTYVTAGLTLYVFGYGIGPMFLSPLQEIPALGRNTVYMACSLLFIILQVPTFVPPNVQTILAFRFLTGVFASPPLATGGASIGDVFSREKLAYVIAIWAQGVNAGPIVGPIVGGYAALIKGWRWPLHEMIWLSSFTFLFMLLLMPETYEPTILYRRAMRLRKLTGNQKLVSPGQKDAGTLTNIFKEALLRPFILAKEPALLFANVYLGFVYAIFYLWYEAFPLVFTNIYHFNLGAEGLPFLGFLVSSSLSFFLYAAYLKYHYTPRLIASIAKGQPLAPESLLEIGLLGSLFIPVSLFIFGWTSRSDVTFMAPIIGAALYIPGIYLNFMSVLMYITMSYPAYAASVLAGNDLFRSTIASVFPLFGRQLFVTLGLGEGRAC